MHLIFQSIGNEWGIPVHEVKEVVRFSRLTPLPFVSPKIVGVFNLRGMVVSVLDASHGDSEERAVIVIDDREYHLGILVDKVLEVRRELDGAKPYDLKGVFQSWIE